MGKKRPQEDSPCGGDRFFLHKKPQGIILPAAWICMVMKS